MADTRIIPIVMPKWGLSMEEGKVTGWLLPNGARIRPGDQILEVETDKIAGAVEATDGGTLRRQLGQADTVYPVKALLGVLSDEAVPDAEIDEFVASYVIPQADAGDEAEAQPSYEFAELPQGRIRYAKRGMGADAVLLIHGFGGDLDNWLFNIDALAESATVHALDLPGHGQSVKALPEPTVSGLAKTVLAFMDAQGIAAAHLVGHSLGGAIALEIARTDKARVKSLTLINSAGLGPDINMDYVKGFAAAASRKELKPVLENLFADPSRVSRQMVDDLLKYKRLDGVDAALKALANGIFTNGRQQAILGDVVQAGGIPALVIAGSGDRIIPPAHAQAARNARVEAIEGAGHMVQMEQAGKVNALIKSHIAQG